MAKLNTGTRIYGTANVDISIYVGTSNTTTGTGGILANTTTLLIGNTSQSTTINNTGITAPNLIRSGTFSVDATSLNLYQPLYVNGTGSLSAGSAGYILASQVLEVQLQLHTICHSVLVVLQLFVLVSKHHMLLVS